LHRHLGLIVAALVVMSGCSSSAPTTPTPASPSVPVLLDGPFNGVWQVGGTITDCDGIRNCVHMRGRPASLTLRLFHVGELVDGTAVMGLKVFDVQGTVHNGELRLTGRQLSAGGCVGEATLTELVLTPTGSGWAGRYHWTSTQPASCSLHEYHVREEVRLESATRVADQPALQSFTGSWEGSVLTASCSPTDVIRVCEWSSGCTDERSLMVMCESGSRHPFRAVLTQSGNQVTGTFRGQPVTGTVVNGRVTLSGPRMTSYTDVSTIPPATFVLDHVGRLHGTYRLEREFIPRHDGPSTVWSQDERLEQVVVR